MSVVARNGGNEFGTIELCYGISPYAMVFTVAFFYGEYLGLLWNKYWEIPDSAAGNRRQA